MQAGKTAGIQPWNRNERKGARIPPMAQRSEALMKREAADTARAEAGAPATGSSRKQENFAKLLLDPKNGKKHLYELKILAGYTGETPTSQIVQSIGFKAALDRGKRAARDTAQVLQSLAGRKLTRYLESDAADNDPQTTAGVYYQSRKVLREEGADRTPPPSVHEMEAATLKRYREVALVIRWTLKAPQRAKRLLTALSARIGAMGRL